jgi:hypothetical protein
MKKSILSHLFVAGLLVFTSSCGSDSTDQSSQLNSEQTSNTDAAAEGLAADLLGTYHGIQPSYNMKNKDGEDLVINGNKVQVPSIDYKFVVEGNHVVSLQQISLEDNMTVNYQGTYRIVSNDENTVTLECEVSDGQNSNPTYVLTINKSDKKGTCSGNNDPEFSIELGNN